jgi:hypothetical protein
LSQKNGFIYLSEIVQHTAQSEQTIMLCLKWIDAQSDMTIHFVADDIYQVEIVPDSKQASNPYSEKLRLRFAESQAYRKHWLSQMF